MLPKLPHERHFIEDLQVAGKTSQGKVAFGVIALAIIVWLTGGKGVEDWTVKHWMIAQLAALIGIALILYLKLGGKTDEPDNSTGGTAELHRDE